MAEKYIDENEQLNTTSKELLNNAIAETDTDKTKSIINLFNLNETKKSMVRLNKLNNIQDTVTNVIQDRIEKNPNNFTTDDLLKIMKVTQDCISNSQQIIDKVDEIPQISIIQNNQVNILEDKLSRESRQKITDAVAKFMQLAKKESETVDKSTEKIYNDEQGDNQ